MPRLNAVLNPICRGLVGYISYLATCRNSTIYSEYLLYEPLLRIAKAQDYQVNCEVPVKNMHRSIGDYKRIDFVLSKGAEQFGLEVKWIKSSRPINICLDIEKLINYEKITKASGYVLIFGQSRFIENARFKKDTKPSITHGDIVEWDAGRTKYSSQWFRFV